MCWSSGSLSIPYPDSCACHKRGPGLGPHVAPGPSIGSVDQRGGRILPSQGPRQRLHDLWQVAFISLVHTAVSDCGGESGFTVNAAWVKSSCILAGKQKSARREVCDLGFGYSVTYVGKTPLGLHLGRRVGVCKDALPLKGSACLS